MWVYLFGHPLDKMLGRLNRLQVRLVLLAVVLIGLVTLGRQYKKFVENDPRTPDIHSENVLKLIRMDAEYHWSVPQSRLFYAVLSDAHLIGQYENYYQSISAEVTDLAQLEAQSCDLLVSSALESAGYSSTEANSIACNISQIESDEELSSYLNSLDLPSEVVNDIVNLSQFSFDTPSLPGLRQARLEQLIRFFANLPREDQLDFLARRLTWVHPVGDPGQDQPAIPLPGLTAEDRFEVLAGSRLEHALAAQPNTSALLREVEYPQNFQTAYSADPFGLGKLQPFGPFERLINKDAGPEIFADLGNRYYVRRLQEQLSLPIAYEAYLAFSEYRILAQELQTEAFARDRGHPVSRRVVNSILDSLENLEPSHREALVHYLVESEESRDNYQALLSLSQIDLTPLKQQEGTAAIRELYGQIEPGASINEDSPLAGIARDILNIPSGDERNYIVQLFNNQNLLVPVQNLLQPDVLQLVTALDSQLIEEQRQELFGVIKNPISVVMPVLISDGFLAEGFSPVGNSDISSGNFAAEAAQSFDLFNRSEYEQQRQYLHQLALSLYQASGQHAHGTFSLIISQAAAWQDDVGLAVAAVMSSPFVVLVVLGGFYAARRLTARDRLRELIVSEASQRGRAQFAMGMTDQMRGRNEVISQLISLAGRGWSSIAIVGRRGVGKTRVLYEQGFMRIPAP